MFKPAKAKTVSEYISAIPKDRRDTIEYLHKFIQKADPKLKGYFADIMLGYGSFPWRNYKNEPIVWPIVGLANQKNYISLYVCAIEGNKYLPEKYAKELGKVSVGKSCIRFKKLEDLDLPALKKLIKQAAKNPGLLDSKRSKA